MLNAVTRNKRKETKANERTNLKNTSLVNKFQEYVQLSFIFKFNKSFFQSSITFTILKTIHFAESTNEIRMNALGFSMVENMHKFVKMFTLLSLRYNQNSNREKWKTLHTIWSGRKANQNEIQTTKMSIIPIQKFLIFRFCQFGCWLASMCHKVRNCLHKNKCNFTIFRSNRNFWQIL